ncbi:hypothetical protein M513_07538 [Trichuris suis]|uniref:Uncharacterized protein n=1 Tax=Trichuris suis TaxID=68888 RepID=A0A085M363_9BILA|nr:hypothetical protein M513_07538 [Trichuris suis]
MDLIAERECFRFLTGRNLGLAEFQASFGSPEEPPSSPTEAHRGGPRYKDTSMVERCSPFSNYNYTATIWPHMP